MSKRKSKGRHPERRETESTPADDQLGEYLRQLQDRADHIYSPGYWLSGQMGYPLARSGRALGPVVLGTGVVLLITEVLAMVRAGHFPAGTEIITSTLGLLMTLAGLRLAFRRRPGR